MVVAQQVPSQGAPQNIRDWDTGLFGCMEDMGGCKFILNIISFIVIVAV